MIGTLHSWSFALVFSLLGMSFPPDISRTYCLCSFKSLVTITLKALPRPFYLQLLPSHSFSNFPFFFSVYHFLFYCVITFFVSFLSSPFPLLPNKYIFSACSIVDLIKNVEWISKHHGGTLDFWYSYWPEPITWKLEIQRLEISFFLGKTVPKTQGSIPLTFSLKSFSNVWQC